MSLRFGLESLRGAPTSCVLLSAVGGGLAGRSEGCWKSVGMGHVADLELVAWVVFGDHSMIEGFVSLKILMCVCVCVCLCAT